MNGVVREVVLELDLDKRVNCSMTSAISIAGVVPTWLRTAYFDALASEK
jgi:hypothetical protein